MKDLNEDIDHYFKDNIDKMEVKFNEAHWDKLQQSLLLVNAAANSSPSSVSSSIKTGIKLKKILLLTSLSVVTLSIGGYFLIRELNTSKPTIKQTDSIKSIIQEPTIIDEVRNHNDSMIGSTVTKSIISSVKMDSIIKINQSALDTNKSKTVLTPIKTVTVNIPVKDTPKTEKKKDVNLFW